MISSPVNSNIRSTLGYYTVGQQYHANKVSALIDGTSRNIHPEWHFNNDFFDKINWTDEPSQDLYALYKQRAQQLRDKYDYLILMYSGGSDSQTIFDVCMANNIMIDEIVVSWATGLSNTYTPDATNHSWQNLQSEWDYTIKPKLEHIARHYPKIKITVNDWVANLQQVNVADDFITDRNHNFGPYTHARWDMTAISSVAAKFDKTYKIGVIFGTDKPRVCINDGHYRLYFLDV